MATPRGIVSAFRAARSGFCAARFAHSRPLVQRAHLTQKRSYASGTPPTKGGNNAILIGGLVAATAGGVAFLFKDSLGTSGVPIAHSSASESGQIRGTFAAKSEDYQKVYDAIAKKLVDEDDYDDGSYGPVLLRLGWHASGTFDVVSTIEKVYGQG